MKKDLNEKKSISTNQSAVQKLVTAALFAALTCMATLIIQIRIGPTGGYINLGDCAVLLCAWLLSPFYGAAAAGIGSMLADLISGFAFYAPATLLIKCAMAFFGGSVFRTFTQQGRKRLLGGCILSAAVAETIMAAGYCAFDAFALGLGAGALLGLPGNLIQALGGGVSAVVAYSLLRRNKALGTRLEHLND